MPLFSGRDECLGTNSDSSKSDQFCHYCYKDGAYTADVAMPEMVKAWVDYTDAYNDHAGTDYTPEDLRSVLERRLPTLSRWKQKMETHNAHYHSIQKIRAYIALHLFGEIDIRTLAAVGGLSESHFRRVFRAITGETVAVFVQRLRLEQIAHLLLSTDDTLERIVHRTNYTTKHALAKAFHKHFGMTTSVYKQRYKSSAVATACLAEPEIRHIDGMCVLYVEVGESYKVEQVYRRKWRRLVEYVRQNQLGGENGKFVSISLDDPLITSRHQCRFYLGTTVPEGTKPIAGTGIFHILPQRYAIFKHIGDYDSLTTIYKSIYEDWLPGSDYQSSGTMTFEVYIRNPLEVSPAELETEICIPIEK